MLRLKSSYLYLSILFLSLALIVSFGFILTSTNNSGEIISFLTFLALLTLTWHLFNRKSKLPLLITCLIFGGFLIRSIFAYHQFTTIISPFPDSFGYLKNLTAVESVNALDFFAMYQAAETSQFGYYYLLLILRTIFQTDYSFYIANIFLFYWSALFLFRVLKKDFSSKISLITTSIYLLSFTLFTFTGAILKDSLVLFLFMAAVYVYKKHSKPTIMLAVLVGFLILTRIYAGFSVFLAIYADYLLNNWKHTKPLKKIINTVLPLALFIFILTSPVFVDLTHSIKMFISQHSLSSYFGSAISGLVQMFFAPYPWGTLKSNVITQYSIIEIDSAFAFMFSFALLIFAVKWIKIRELRSKMHFYLIPIFIHAVTLGLQYDGGSVRQRISVFGFMILIFVLGMFYKKDKTKEG